MKLKSLEIIGFKSFADKTKLDFDPGITAIVGPNGCGKSNISDAFRWVLGEQSAKSLRGGKMPDVIFAGTSHRKPLNFAEVTLTLSDINGQLPTEYDELAITRRLHRNGESEYLINRHPVRLKDVQALFLDSGMGKDAYSIFEQGKIDQVINLSPYERRYIFEEAAGILRFLQRKKEALRKLEQTDLNVSRVKDIHQEVERQIIILEEQSEKARQYRENQDALVKLEKCLLASKSEVLQAKMKEAKAKGVQQDDLITTENLRIEGMQQQLVEAKQTLVAVEKEWKQRSENVYSARSSKELQAKEKQTNQERLKDLAAKEKRWEEELKGMAERRQQREEERKKLLRQQKETEKRFQAVEATVLVERTQVKSLEEELLKEREQQQSKQKELFKLMQAESQCESEIRQVNVRLENSQERHARIEERKTRLSSATLALLQQNEEKKQQLEEAAGGVEKQKQEFVAMEAGLQEVAQEISRTQEELDRVNQESSDLKARQKALLRFKQDMEGFSAGSKKLLQEAANPKSPIFSKLKGLYEYLIPEKGAEAALAAAMKPYAQTLVVEKEADFDEVVRYIKSCDIKDTSLICLEALLKDKKGKHDKTPEGLSALVKSIAENGLSAHFLKEVYVGKKDLKALDAVKAHSPLEIWLYEGAFVDRRSVVFFSSQGENNVFLREAELKVLEKKLHEIEAEKQQLEVVLRTLQQKRHQIQQDRTALDKIIRRDEMKLVELNFAVHKASADLEKMSGEEKMLAADWQAVTQSIESLTASLTTLRDKHRAAKEVAAEAQKQTEKLTERLAKLMETVKGQTAGLRSQEHALHLVVDEQRKQTHALHVLDVKDTESRQQEARLEQEIEMGQVLQGQMISKGSEAETLLKELEYALSDAVAASNELEKRVVIQKSAVEHIETKLQEKRNLLKKHETDRNQVSIQCAQLESQISALENELQERHKSTVTEVQSLAAASGQSIDQMEKQIRHLKQLIANAGDINMTSIEECEKYKTRYHFLNQQMDDLGMSKEELIGIISELDGESRQIFQRTFQQVRENFRKNFEILFNGGEADLQFTESADVLEAGIEIIAKPPGKQMRSIQLLSGGEKCLTAMALLFAIFEVKPAPFCILDEIDAPLDDANVERFVNIVKQFVENCQFIIITHNKRTMAIADVICGVSMEEKGVSKMLNINFSKHKLSEMAAI